MLIDKTKEQVVELQTGQKEQFDASNCEDDTRVQQNLAISSLLGSSVLDNKPSPAEDIHKTDAHRELEATPSDHCDSMSKSSLPDHKVIVSSPINEGAINRASSIPAEPSGSSTASDQVIHTTTKVSFSFTNHDKNAFNCLT